MKSHRVKAYPNIACGVTHRRMPSQDCLPVQSDRFIGRSDTLHQMKTLLHDEEIRLVTVTGPPGIGKTRLVIEAASGLRERFQDGIRYISFETATEPFAALFDLASTLLPIHDQFAMEEASIDPLIDALAGHLASQHMLVILDQVDDCPVLLSVIEAVLAKAPAVRFVVTTRGRTALTEEHVFTVSNLEIPSESHDPETLETIESVRLFIEVARTVYPTVSFNAPDVITAGDICRHLHGHPLAIKITASHFYALPLPELSDQIKRLTITEPSDVPDAVMDWAYSRLSSLTDRQKILDRLSIFPGGFSEAAARDVCLWLDFNGVLSYLHTIGMVRVDEEAGETRYRLEPSVRNFVQKRRTLEAADIRDISDRHIRHYLTFMQRHHKVTFDDLSILDLDLPNLRMVMDRAIEEKDWILAGDFGAACAHYFYTRGYWFEGPYILNRAVQAIKQGGDPARLPQILRWLGFIYCHQGWYEIAEQTLLDLMEAGYAVNDLSAVGEALMMRGALRRYEGDEAGARSLFRESLAVRRQAGDKWGIAVTQNNLACNIIGSKPEEAEAYFIDNMRIERELGGPESGGFPLDRLIDMSTHSGDEAKAERWLRERLKRARDGGRISDQCDALYRFGMFAKKQEYWEEAMLLHQTARSLYTEAMTEAGTSPERIAHIKNTDTYIQEALDEIRDIKGDVWFETVIQYTQDTPADQVIQMVLAHENITLLQIEISG